MLHIRMNRQTCYCESLPATFSLFLPTHLKAVSPGQNKLFFLKHLEDVITLDVNIAVLRLYIHFSVQVEKI